MENAREAMRALNPLDRHVLIQELVADYDKGTHIAILVMCTVCLQKGISLGTTPSPHLSSLRCTSYGCHVNMCIMCALDYAFPELAVTPDQSSAVKSANQMFKLFTGTDRIREMQSTFTCDFHTNPTLFGILSRALGFSHL